MNTMGKLALVGSVLALGALGAWGCQERSGTAIVGNSPPEGGGDAPTPVSVSRTLTFFGPNGDTRTERRTDTAFALQVRRGGAGSTGGPGVAMSRPFRTPEGPVVFVDSAGQEHTAEFQVEGGDDAPPTRIVLLVDGQVTAVADMSWRADGDYYVLESRNTAFHVDGGPMAVESVTTGTINEASLFRPGRELARALAPVRGLVAPSVLLAEPVQWRECLTEWIRYAGVGLAMVLAAQRVYARWYAPSSWAAFLIAVGAWESAWGALITCYIVHAE